MATKSETLEAARVFSDADVVKRVLRGETVTIADHGKPVMDIVPRKKHASGADLADILTKHHGLTDWADAVEEHVKSQPTAVPTAPSWDT